MKRVRENHIAVCICTYRRPELLKRLLEGLECQDTAGSFTYSIVVADNDADRSAEAVVSSFADRSAVEIVYCCEPKRNIALARNKTIENADGEFIAFIDDDEFPLSDWLARLLNACDEYKAAGVLGPVRPHFEAQPPAWIVKGRFCERPEHRTGTVMPWTQCRTGNVLFRSSILDGASNPFNAEFGTGGEDVDFFMRMSHRGFNFVWCNEAIAYEAVPPSRWSRRYMLKRALLRGKNTLARSTGRTGAVAQSVIAVPIYSLVLPVSLLFGQHFFMNYCIRFCDHLGRLLALLGINPIRERQM